MLFQERERDHVSLTVHRLISQQGAGHIPIFHYMRSSTDCIPRRPASSATKLHSFIYSYLQLHAFLYANRTPYTSPLWEHLRGIMFTCKQRSENKVKCAFEDWTYALLVLVYHIWKETESGGDGMVGCCAACGKPKC